MNAWDTEVGGNAVNFPETTWSRILAAAKPHGQREAFERLARQYWKPVYCFIRKRHADSNEEAKDRTQDFFVWMMEKGFLAKADPNRGRFRPFLKASLENYLRKQDRTDRALRRGGDRLKFTIDDADLEAGAFIHPETRDPGHALDEAWRKSLLERALHRLQEELAQSGKGVRFDVFRTYFLDASTGSQDYADLSKRFGIPVSNVSNHLQQVKARFRDILIEEVSETVTDAADLEIELKWLFRKGQS